MGRTITHGRQSARSYIVPQYTYISSCNCGSGRCNYNVIEPERMSHSASPIYRFVCDRDNSRTRVHSQSQLWIRLSRSFISILPNWQSQLNGRKIVSASGLHNYYSHCTINTLHLLTKCPIRQVQTKNRIHFSHNPLFKPLINLNLKS